MRSTASAGIAVSWVGRVLLGRQGAVGAVPLSASPSHISAVGVTPGSPSSTRSRRRETWTWPAGKEPCSRIEGHRITGWSSVPPPSYPVAPVPRPSVPSSRAIAGCRPAHRPRSASEALPVPGLGHPHSLLRTEVLSQPVLECQQDLHCLRTASATAVIRARVEATCAVLKALLHRLSALQGAGGSDWPSRWCGARPSSPLWRICFVQAGQIIRNSNSWRIQKAGTQGKCALAPSCHQGRQLAPLLAG